MVVKINNKPVIVTENSEEKSFSWTYWCVSGVGYGLIFWILDYVCFTFCFIHPFPWIVWIGKVISFIGGIF
jgi:hypothetical protein